METLKPLAEVLEPDERTTHMVLLNRRTNEIKPWTLEHVHREVSSITLNECVPEEIRDHFAQAQNLALYAWFNYQFHVTADFMSMVSIEYALKVRLKKNSSFKHLIGLAVKEGLIKDEGFTHIRGKQVGRSYVETLTEVLPGLRNDYAHGSRTLHNQSLTPLRIAADFINQLFPAGGG